MTEQLIFKFPSIVNWPPILTLPSIMQSFVIHIDAGMGGFTLSNWLANINVSDVELKMIAAYELSCWNLILCMESPPPTVRELLTIKSLVINVLLIVKSLLMSALLNDASCFSVNNAFNDNIYYICNIDMISFFLSISKNRYWFIL